VAELSHGVASEGQSQAHEFVEDAAQTPDVCLGVVLLVIHDFWGHIVGSSDLCRSQFDSVT